MRVYYEDTDCGGVVYHASYLRFFERARSEWLRERGFEQDNLREQHGMLFAVHSMNLAFIRPARFNQVLVIGTEISKSGKASLVFDQRIVEPGWTRLPGSTENIDLPSESTRICSARVRIACLDAETFKPIPIPRPIVEEIVRGRF